jgi:hypothetical protein
VRNERGKVRTNSAVTSVQSPEDTMPCKVQSEAWREKSEEEEDRSLKQGDKKHTGNSLMCLQTTQKQNT